MMNGGFSTALRMRMTALNVRSMRLINEKNGGACW